MKREILFRGRLSHSKRWIEGNLIIATNGNPYIVPSESIEPDGHHLMIEDKAFWVDTETVGQFTGLSKSKNHPMFDDRIKLWEDDVFIFENSRTKYKVALENYEWIGVSNEGDDWGKHKYKLSAIKGTIRIIGNIHDNPELI